MSAAEKIRRLHRLYAVSSGINEAIVRMPEERQLYEEACRIAVERGGFAMAWVGYNDEQQARLVPVARWGRDEGYVDAVRISTDPSQREGRGPGGTAFRTGAAAVCNDIEADNQFFAYRKEALARGFRSCAAFPLKLEGRSVAVFLVYAGEPQYFDAEEMALLMSLADNFSFAMESRAKDARRLRVENALRDSEAQQRATIERLQHKQGLLSMASRLGRLGAWEVELPSLAITWSEELAVIHDMPPDFAPTFQEARAFIAPEDREAVAATFTACANEGTPFDLELQVITAAGRRLCVRSIGEAVRDASGAITRVQGAFQDITDRKLAEEEIHQLAERLTTTLESITDALVTVDAQWRFTYVNRAAEQVLRRSRTELLGTNMWEEFPQGRGTTFEAAYDQALAEGRTVELQEFYPPLDTWLEIRAYPSREGGLTVYFRDVGERRAAQEEILRLNAELEHRVRLRTAQLEMANQELQAFSYSVAHDLRAPLAAISGFGHALQDVLPPDAGGRALHYLTRIRQGALRTSEMIDALLSLAQLSRAELRWEPVDLSAMARATVQGCREQEPGREADIEIQPGMMAHGDPRLLQLVMDNLVGNAWKFTARATRAEISVRAQPEADGTMVYSVRDNGVGFDIAYAHNLFGAFQRLHPGSEYPGSGIGLANVRRIVARHSGRIWAESSPGEGSTFYFTLGTEPA
jgi:PAS domain S-box-containing protein